MLAPKVNPPCPGSTPPPADLFARFDAVLATYDVLLSRAVAPDRLTLVMTDVIGFQDWSLALYQHYRDRIRGYIDAGADVLVPIPDGALPPREAYDAISQILGTSDFRVGIPSKKAAWSQTGPSGRCTCWGCPRFGGALTAHESG